jgi:S-adenosylmethionine:tRNA ribosyltransferase-isomerase
MDKLLTNDYFYELPQERIAVFPLDQRDQAKLLVYNNGQITHDTFTNLPARLPKNAFLFFNDTKVIPARLHFKKDTGADIEIFLLSPTSPSVIISETMASNSGCRWLCTIGNLKRWTENLRLTKNQGEFVLTATLVDRNQGIVEFNWNTDISFAEVISATGQTPLPPYLRREPQTSDKQRYQTIYSHYDGAVAAPTAGLHFTETTFSELRTRNIAHDFLTLHVSAGTFQPIKAENANEHTMHQEQIVITRTNIENLLIKNRTTIPVGTTSMRTLESLYWYGTKLLNDSRAAFKIEQNDPYDRDSTPSREDALYAVIKKMNEMNSNQLIGETAIMIRPGYRFQICEALITNFHQPASTLILLVAALIGPDWKRVYKEALENNYRFLSYGDSSLLIPAAN